MVKKYNKITTGFVIQEFVEEDGEFVCTGQMFVAGDQVDYDDLNGESIDIKDIDTSKEQYQPFDMVQPD